MRIDRHGSGPQTFLGLHGWNGGRHTFEPLLKALPENITFLSADLPGCGGSPPPASWDLRAIAREIAAGLSAPVTLVGNCSGGILALAVALADPSRVTRIVLIDTFARWPWYFRIFVSPGIGRYAYFATFANPVGRWLTNASLKSKRQTGTDLTGGFREADHRTTYRYLTMLRDLGGPEQFAGLEMPIDVLYGEHSFGAVRDSAHYWASLWPQARVFEMKGAGHLPILEAAPQMQQILFGGNYVEPNALISPGSPLADRVGAGGVAVRR